MDELHKSLIEILIAGAKAVSEKSAVVGAKRAFEAIKRLLKRDGVSAVDKLGGPAPENEIAQDLSRQLQKSPAALSSPEILEELRAFLASGVTLEGVTGHRNLLIRNIEGRVSIFNSTLGGDITIEGVTRGAPLGN